MTNFLLSQTRVKGGCPLRVQGRARIILAVRHPADRRKPNPTKQNVSFALFIADRRTRTPPQAKRQFCAFYCRKAPRRQAHPNPTKQNVSFAQSRVKGRGPLRVQGGARIILADRQSPPTGAPEPLKAKRQFCAFYCRQAISADRRTRTPPQAKR